MKPIPKSLLIHSAVLYEIVENSWQEQEKKLIAELSRVRVEPSTKMIITGNNRSVTLSAVLFYDCRNSVPTVKFEPGQRLEFGGKLFTVETVEALYDKQKLHHLEVGLS